MDTTRRAKGTKALFLLIPITLVIPLLFLVGNRTVEEKTPFYREPMKESDVWRLPLLEPYELITAYCCEDWNFQQGEHTFTTDSVNYAKGYILYFEYPGTYGFLDTQRQRMVRLATHCAFVDSLVARGIPTTLYKTETVYRDWVRTGQLPWATEILATQRARQARPKQTGF